jgi:hypothetical protein
MEIGEATVQEIIVHQVGNRLREEPLLLANNCVASNENLASLILGSYLAGITKDRNLHILSHETDLSLNAVSYYARSFFFAEISFIDLSKKLATHLYSSTHHPNIAAGDLFIIHFDKLKLDDEYRSAIGIYKSESKQTYIASKSSDNSSELEVLTGINPELIDKGALIIQGSETIYALDRLSSRTKYWLEDFLKAKQIADEKLQYAITTSLIEKVTENIKDPVSKQRYSSEIVEFCEITEEISDREIKEISEKYVPSNIWDSEFDVILEKKQIVRPAEIRISSKKLEGKIRKSMSKVSLGNDLTLLMPKDIHFDSVQFEQEGSKINISILLERKNG